MSQLRQPSTTYVKWAISGALKQVEMNYERSDKNLREKSEVLNWESLKFPVSLIYFGKFENNNSSISVNVFSYEKLVYPLRISEHNYKRESSVNLLLTFDDKKHDYCLTKDIGKLLSLQTSKDGHVRHVRFRCLNTFNSKESLPSHHEYCKS